MNSRLKLAWSFGRDKGPSRNRVLYRMAMSLQRFYYFITRIPGNPLELEIAENVDMQQINGGFNDLLT